MRPSPWLLGLPALTACDPATLIWPPLKEGPYEIQLMALVEDTCGYTEDDVGVGRVEVLDLSWQGEVLVMSDGEGEGQYLWTGQVFEALGYGESPVDETCTLIIESILVGEPLARDRFGLFDDMVLSAVGDCSAWDTSMMPCGATLAWEGNLVED